MSESPAQETRLNKLERDLMLTERARVFTSGQRDAAIAQVVDLAQQLEQAEQRIKELEAERAELRHDSDYLHERHQQTAQRIKELERALEIAVSCVGNYAADSNLGEALAAVGINRHPEEDSDEG
jgi:chromosome segregation ATPase